MKKLRKMKVETSKDRLVIEIPLSLLKAAIERHPDFNVEVLSTEAMALYYERNLLGYTDVYKVGQGDQPDLCDLLDHMAEDAFESGEPWLKDLDEEEE